MVSTLSFFRPVAFSNIRLVVILLLAPVFANEICSLQVFPNNIPYTLVCCLSRATCPSHVVLYLITHIYYVTLFLQAVGCIHWNTEYQWQLSLRPLFFWDVTWLMSVTFDPSRSVSFRHTMSPICSHFVKLVPRATISSKTFPGRADVCSSAHDRYKLDVRHFIPTIQWMFIVACTGKTNRDTGNCFLYFRGLNPDLIPYM
jgi:hypothetical protein